VNDAGLRKSTGIFLILTPIAFNVFFTLLSVTFDYPDILREPTGHVLRRFDAGGSGLVAIWYGFMLTAVLFVPLAILVHKVLARQDTPYMAVAAAFGVVGGVVQFLGLVRWPFLVPYLADTYLDPASSGATRESVAVVFQAFNQYAGVGVGENLGYLFTGLWTLLVAMAMFGSPLPFRRWLALLGVVSAVGIVIGILEPAGFEPAANIVVVGYVLWSIWLALTSILLLLPGSIRNRAPQSNQAGDPAPRIESLAGSDLDRYRRARGGRVAVLTLVDARLPWLPARRAVGARAGGLGGRGGVRRARCSPGGSGDRGGPVVGASEVLEGGCWVGAIHCFGRGDRRRRRGSAHRSGDGDRRSANHWPIYWRCGGAAAVGAPEGARPGCGAVGAGGGGSLAGRLDGDVGSWRGRRAGLRRVRLDGCAGIRGDYRRGDATPAPHSNTLTRRSTRHLGKQPRRGETK